jgi:hypothetical protein
LKFTLISIAKIHLSQRPIKHSQLAVAVFIQPMGLAATNTLFVVCPDASITLLKKI